MTVFTFLSWLLLIWALGWLSLPLARRIWGTALGGLPDAGLAAGRLILLWGWTLLAFWLGYLRLSTRLGGFLIYLIAALCLYYAWREWPALRELARERRRALILSDAVFFGVFLLFFILRGFWPDINNGEKPMDMILISSLTKANYLPPPNPYAAGFRLSSYYYLGHLQTALCTNALGLDPRWTYNLMSATLPALCYSALASLAAALTGRLRNGLIAATLLLTAGTLEPLRQWFMAPGGGETKWWPLDYFATSRVIPNTINEYPWFTFNYADLHAHYFAMPLTLLIVSLGWALYWRRDSLPKERFTQIVAGICALALGALLVTNTWDFPVYALLIGFCLVSLKTLESPLPDASASVRSSAPVAAFAVRASSSDESLDEAGDENHLPAEEAIEAENEPPPAPKPRPRRTTRRVAAEATSATDEAAPAAPRRPRRTTPATRAGQSSPGRTPRAAAAKSARTTSGRTAPARPAVKPRPPAPLHTNPFVRAGMAAAVIGGVALLAASPFLTKLRSEAQGPNLLEQPGSATGAWLLLWAPIIGAWVLTLITEARHRLAADPSEGTLMKRFIVIPVGLWLLGKIVTGNDHFVLIFLVTLTLWTGREAFYVRQQDQLYTWLCRAALCGLLALVWSETTWAGFLGPPHHRQDTVFKFGLQAWYLLGIAAAGAAFRHLPTATPEEPESPDVVAWKFWPRPAQFAFLAMLLVTLVASASTVTARARDFHQFDGWDAWHHLAPPERRAAAWLSRQGGDGVYLLEAEEKKGGDYTEYTRYAHATGLAGVIGPQAHTFQWGVSWDDVLGRKEDVRAFYTTDDPARAAEILRKYNVRYVVVGQLERGEYGEEAAARVEQRMRVVFQEGEGAQRTTILAAE